MGPRDRGALDAATRGTAYPTPKTGEALVRHARHRASGPGSPKPNPPPSPGRYFNFHFGREGGSPPDPLPPSPLRSSNALPPPPYGCTPQEEGGYPPSPLLPFQMFEPTAKILLRPLPCQEDLRFKIFGPPLAGTIGGPWEEGSPQPTPPPLPFSCIPPPPGALTPPALALDQKQITSCDRPSPRNGPPRPPAQCS